MNIQSNSGDNALIYATKEEKINCVQKLIELGANINIQGGDGRTALMHATKRKNEHGKCLEALLEGGANPDITDHIGHTALTGAIAEDSLVSVDKLIKAGVNVNVTPKRLITPLSVAVWCEKVGIVKKIYQSWC